VLIPLNPTAEQSRIGDAGSSPGGYAFDMISGTAAAFVTEARLARRKLGPLPPLLRPADEAAAYAVQDQASAILKVKGFGTVIGYKIGCTTAAMQTYLGIDHPCAGYMYAGSLRKDGVTLARKEFVRPGVECEIAVTLSAPLRAKDAPFSRTNVEPAVGAVHAAIEIVDERYEDWRTLGGEILIADDFFHAGLILGPAIADWRSLDLPAVNAVTRVNGKETGRGRGADVLGHPLDALVWLANHCAARGKDMPAGSIVSLGALVPVQWLSPGDRAEIELEGLGTLSFRVEI
jgi:2-oxo-3-hexenedioate decarboxylase/2-keto-4-pentenoate hydratase